MKETRYCSQDPNECGLYNKPNLNQPCKFIVDCIGVCPNDALLFPDQEHFEDCECKECNPDYKEPTYKDIHIREPSDSPILKAIDVIKKFTGISTASGVIRYAIMQTKKREEDGK